MLIRRFPHLLCLTILPTLFLSMQVIANSAGPSEDETPRLRVVRIDGDFDIESLDDPNWDLADEVTVGKYWSGQKAPEGRSLKARLLWSESHLYVRFETGRDEPLVISDEPVTDRKTIGLWDRDVCELFIAPDKKDFRRYFEFEAAPTGEWLDLGIHQMPDERETDWDYDSGMAVSARIDEDRVFIAFRVRWSALGRTPSEGDVWPGNLYRAVGEGDTRGYLAWSPTMTAEPNFHVPEKFGEFEFAAAREKE